MTTNWKALCAELVEKVGLITWGSGTPEDLKELLNRARAALAEQPVWEGPPAVTTGAWLHPAYEPGDGSADGAQMVELAWWHPQFGCDSLQMVVDNARAILARWSNPAPPHDPWKEVLLDALVCNFLLEKEHENNPKKALNDLIAWEKQLATDPLINPAPQPVPVSERLPEPEDCDAEGRCWWGEPQIEDSHDATWNLCTQDDAEEFCTWGTKCGWLSFHALPLPEQEVSK